MCPGLPDYNEGVQVISCWLPYPIKKSQKLSGYTKRVGRLSGDEKGHFLLLKKVLCCIALAISELELTLQNLSQRFTPKKLQ